MTEIRVPKMGPTTVEVEVMELLVSEGQRIATGDPVAEVETEKTEVTIEATAAGIVTGIRVSVGDICEIGAVLCTVETAG